MQATSTPKLVAQPPAALAALAAILFAAGIALGAVMDLDLRIPSTAPVAAPDTSYNAVEKLRAQFGITPDTSYDTVESLRAKSGVTEDTSLKGRSGFPSTRGTVAGTPVSQADPNDRYGAGIR